ncbi:kama family protein [Hypoxylon sp. FL0890]|nr:kama family protein [Hypoxylon sp. FL0890]
MLSSTHRGHQALVHMKRSSAIPRTSPSIVRRLSTSVHRQDALVTRPLPELIPRPVPIPAAPRALPVPYLAWPRTPLGAPDEFWRPIPQWKDIPLKDFASWRWGVKNAVEAKKDKRDKLMDFLHAALPEEVPRAKGLHGLQSRLEFMADVVTGLRNSAMSVRIMPYILSRINWTDPANDPIFRQFIPLGSIMIDDHEFCKLDSLNEKNDRPVDLIVHRYPDKALFLPTSVCPTYCLFCTRSYGIGANTVEVTKEHYRGSLDKINAAFDYIESQEGLHDIVVSGGDAFYLSADVLESIGDRLIASKNIERFRFASKGLAVAPHRFLDQEDPWTDTLIRISDRAKRAGKHMALHTHFNHPNEISWITERASLKLLQAGITVRNQTVLLRGVNDNVDTMSTLIKKLGKMAIQPYYVYQCDMVPKIEHLRTPLRTILDIESQIQGTVAGFYIPKFVVDLPGGGGKRPASLCESYDRKKGISTFTQPALKSKGRGDKVYKYYDPVEFTSGP